MSIVHSILHFGYGSLLRIKNLAKLPFQKKFYKADTYYPEYSDKRESSLSTFFHQASNILRYGAPNSFYFAYGLDIQGFKWREYVDYTLFMKQRNFMNNRFGSMSSMAVLRNKDLFGIVSDAYGYPTPHNIGIISNNEIYLFDSKKQESIDLYVKSNNIDAFIKKIDGECADGVFPMKIKDRQVIVDGKTSDNWKEIFKNGVYLLQNRITAQHPAISAIYPHSINTIRLVTVINPKTNKPEVFSALLRVGASGSNVDNWAVGGLAIGIDLSTHKLKKYGFYKPGFGLKTERHPDTDIVFESYTIPFMEDAVSMALAFHSRLRTVHSIGWDIAITESGPCFVEGNDNWEISLMQVPNKGYDDEFKRLFYS